MSEESSAVNCRKGTAPPHSLGNQAKMFLAHKKLRDRRDLEGAGSGRHMDRDPTRSGRSAAFDNLAPTCKELKWEPSGRVGTPAAEPSSRKGTPSTRSHSSSRRNHRAIKRQPMLPPCTHRRVRRRCCRPLPCSTKSGGTPTASLDCRSRCLALGSIHLG